MNIKNKKIKKIKNSFKKTTKKLNKPHPVLNDKQVQLQHPNKLNTETFVLPHQTQTVQEEHAVMILRIAAVEETRLILFFVVLQTSP